MIEIDKEMYVVIGTIIGALVGAISAYISARVISKNQIKITEINKEKDIQLQKNKLNLDMIKRESDLYRSKLERFHSIITKISLENSLTMSYIQSDNRMELNIFRENYLANCGLLNEAQAIADLYYPKLSQLVRKINGQSNIFWGHQESILRVISQQNSDNFRPDYHEILRVSQEIESLSSLLISSISDASREIINKMNLKF